MKIPLEPGDEVVSMVRIEDHMLVITRHGRFYEVRYEGMGCYTVQQV